MKRFTILITGAVIATTVFAGCGDDAKSGSTSGAYCARIQEYKDKSDELDAVFTDAPDAKNVEAAFTKVQSMVHDLKTGAPAEIKADVDTMSDAIDNVVAIFSKYDWDFAALAAAPEFAELQDEFAGADMEGATERLEAYSETICGIASDSTSP